MRLNKRLEERVEERVEGRREDEEKGGETKKNKMRQILAQTNVY